jgi:hypothetical protein
MSSEREKLESASLGRLADDLQHGPTSGAHDIAHAELQRRLAVWQFEARDAEVRAATAAEETARYTRSSARWMFWSVVTIAITSGITGAVCFPDLVRADGVPLKVIRLLHGPAN